MLTEPVRVLVERSREEMPGSGSGESPALAIRSASLLELRSVKLRP